MYSLILLCPPPPLTVFSFSVIEYWRLISGLLLVLLSPLLPHLSVPQAHLSLSPLWLTPSRTESQNQPHRHPTEKDADKRGNITFSHQFTPPALITPISAPPEGGRCFIYLPQGSAPKNYLEGCWLSGAVEGLSPLLKDVSSKMKNESHVFFSPIGHSSTSLSTPISSSVAITSKHPGRSPGVGASPPSHSRSSEASHASSSSFPTTHCSRYDLSGLWWMTEYGSGGGGAIELDSGREKCGE